MHITGNLYAHDLIHTGGAGEVVTVEGDIVMKAGPPDEFQPGDVYVHGPLEAADFKAWCGSRPSAVPA